jgi:hypothetical protein
MLLVAIRRQPDNKSVIDCVFGQIQLKMYLELAGNRAKRCAPIWVMCDGKKRRTTKKTCPLFQSLMREQKALKHIFEKTKFINKKSFDKQATH